MGSEAPPARAELLAQISITQERLNQIDVALINADKLIAYGTALHDDAIVAKGMLTKGWVFYGRNDTKGAQRLVREAETLARRSANPALLAQTATAAGEAADEQGDFPTALAKLQLAVDTARKVTDDPVPLLNALKTLIRLYIHAKEKEKAYAALDELQALVKQQPSLVRTVQFKTAEYNVNDSFGEPRRAQLALLDSLALQRQLGLKGMLTSTLDNLSDSYLRQSDYARAAQYASEALSLAKGSNVTAGEAVAHINLGHAYLGLRRVAEGKGQYEAGLAWFEKSGDKPQLQEVLLEYGQALENAGDLHSALRAYHRERILSSELFEVERRKSMLELQEKYEAEKRQHQIELLSNENRIKSAQIDNHRLRQRIWWLLSMVFGVTTLAVGLLYRKVRHANAALATKNLELKVLSTHDPLTSLYNRRHFQDHMHGAPASGQGQPADNTIGALFLLDVDHFKHINDSYGHAAGDAVLKIVAERLRVALRGTDMIVRWGGEEFLAYLPTIPCDGADDIARRILNEISATPVRYGEHAITVQASLGFAPFPLAYRHMPLPWERVVNLIDMALYLAKTQGRNRAYGVQGFSDARHATLDVIEKNLEHAFHMGLVGLSVVLGCAPDHASQPCA